MKTNAFAFLFVSLVSVNAFAQFVLPPSRGVTPRAEGPNTYGTASTIIATALATEFVPWFNTNTISVININRYIDGNFAIAPLHLPAGALVSGFEVEGCDTSTTGTVIAAFFQCPDGTQCISEDVFVNTGDTAAPGCGRFPATLSTPVTVNNAVNKYFLYVSNSTTDGTTNWGAMRVRYKLQVSPAPATATFADVPVGSPLHRFVEALYASGITAGCAGGNYCPNDPITRGQMAVFLSAALGLHFPN